MTLLVSTTFSRVSRSSGDCWNKSLSLVVTGPWLLAEALKRVSKKGWKTLRITMRAANQHLSFGFLYAMGILSPARVFGNMIFQLQPNSESDRKKKKP